MSQWFEPKQYRQFIWLFYHSPKSSLGKRLTTDYLVVMTLVLIKAIPISFYVSQIWRVNFSKVQKKKQTWSNHDFLHMVIQNRLGKWLASSTCTVAWLSVMVERSLTVVKEQNIWKLNDFHFFCLPPWSQYKFDLSEKKKIGMAWLTLSSQSSSYMHQLSNPFYPDPPTGSLCR